MNSIRFLYHHFLSGITEKLMNTFYYACSYPKVDYFRLQIYEYHSKNCFELNTGFLKNVAGLSLC